MSAAFVIEVDGEPAGVVLAEGAGVRFFASDRRYWELEGRLFRTARHAERAAASMQTQRLAAADAAAQRRGAVVQDLRAGIWADTIGRYLGAGQPAAGIEPQRAVA